MKTLTPKFLTKEIAEKAVATALRLMQDSPLKELVSRQACHIVVLVPEMDDGRPDFKQWPDYSIRAHVLFEFSVGDRKTWPGPFDGIARSKALQLWQERNDDRTDCEPHLLFPGDTQYWGGVKRHGIVVACSGVQAWFDKMLSGIVAELCLGLAYDAFMTSPDKKSDAAFLK